MQIGDIVRFNEKAGQRTVNGVLESLNGKVFLILEKEYLRESGGFSFNGIHLPFWDWGGNIPFIPYPWLRDYFNGTTGVWDEWRSKDCFFTVGHVNLAITVHHITGL